MSLSHDRVSISKTMPQNELNRIYKFKYQLSLTHKVLECLFKRFKLAYKLLEYNNLGEGLAKTIKWVMKQKRLYFSKKHIFNTFALRGVSDEPTFFRGVNIVLTLSSPRSMLPNTGVRLLGVSIR